jgi:hypothetical protein
MNGPAAAPDRIAGQVFGIEVVAPSIVPLAPAGHRRRGRTTVKMTSADVLKRRWQPDDANRFVERRYHDGRLSMTVDHDEQCGYLIYAPWYGRYLVAPDGGSILSTMPNVPLWRWQIVLFAQALPLAATLQGLELLHASAVRVDGKLVAFSAPSGTGKTSTAAHLVADGATLLTDDVLAIDRSDGRILGFPGAPLTKVARGELATMTAAARARLGAHVGRNDKNLLLASVPQDPFVLDGLYFLQRSDRFRSLSITRLEPNPFRLLAHSFNTYVRTRERVANQLAIHAALAETVPLHLVEVPPSAQASDVARAVRTHSGEVL